MYSNVPNKRARTFISGKVCLLTLIEPEWQTLPEINVHARLFGTLEYLTFYPSLGNLTTHYLDIPTTHQDISEWKPITRKSTPIQQKSRYKHHKSRSSRKNYKYKRDIDPNDNIADIYDSSTMTPLNRRKRQFSPPAPPGGGPAATEEPILEEEDLFDLVFDVRN